MRPARSRLLAAGFAVASLAACGPRRVQLPDPPPPDAAPAVREAAYEEVRATDFSASYLVEAQTRRLLVGNLEHVELADGTQVEHPGDLLPWVYPGSRTARLVARYEAHAEAADYSAYPAGGLLLAGLGLGAAAAFVDRGRGEMPTVALLASGVGALGAGVILYLLGSEDRDHREQARMAAFCTYDADLRTRLGLPHDPSVGTCRER